MSRFFKSQAGLSSSRYAPFLSQRLKRCMPPRLSVILFLLAAMLVGTGHAQAADTVTYYYTDQQGTVLATADAAGNVVSRTDYRPYGVLAGGSQDGGPGYTGHIWDIEPSLIYMQARFYDPTVARFLSTDPVTTQTAKLSTFGRYAYAANNPTTKMDLDGRDTVGENIDQYAQAASDSGNRLATFGWAFAGAAWNILGAESVSQVADKGTAAGAGNIAMAAISIATLGKGEEAANVAKGVIDVAEDAARSSGTLFHYTDAAGAAEIEASGVIRADGEGRVFLAADKISSGEANNALFMGVGGSKGSHVVEVELKQGSVLSGNSQANELVHQGSIRDGRQAYLTVKKNEN